MTTSVSERRPDATLSEATKQSIVAESRRHLRRGSALLPALKIAQRERGWLPPEVLDEVADLLELPRSKALELASFYSMLFTEEVAPVRVEMCVQLPCALRGADARLDALAERTGVALHGPAHARHGRREDGLVELHATVECFGSCHRAPMCRVGDAYRECLDDDDKIDALAQELLALARDRSRTGGGEP